MSTLARLNRTNAIGGKLPALSATH